MTEGQTTQAGSFRIGIAAFPPVPGDLEANIDHLARAARSMAPFHPGLVLLPELWATGLLSHRDARVARGIACILDELGRVARETGAAFVGTLPEPAGREHAYNTTFFTTSDGTSRPVYRKVHLFAPMGETDVFTPGTEARAMELRIGSMTFHAGCLTCFDMRFPELARHLAYQGATLLLVSALWPAARKMHLEALARARAIENQCFVAVSNPRGRSGELELAGPSAVVDPTGNAVEPVAKGTHWQVVEADISLAPRARAAFNTLSPPGAWLSMSARKLVSHQRLVELLGPRRAIGHRVVFTNGCFDLIHPGHVEYLEEARGLGDILVVGLNSDASVREIKGPRRPVNPEKDRARVLCGLQSVDYVTLFHQPTPLELIEKIVPDVLVKGADWEEDEIVGAQLVRAAGGRVARIPFRHGTSTTDTIRRIIRLQGR